MKLKGINLFERYADKLVLGVVAAAALGVVAMQFLTEPNKVTIGKDTLPPAQAYKPVADAASELIARVNSSNPELPPAPKTDVLTRFKSDLGRDVAPSSTLVAMGPILALGESNADLGASASGGPVATFSIPAPGNVMARSFGGSVDPLEVIAHPDIKKLPGISKEQPFDLFAVSVECAFDGAAFKDTVQTDPDGAGPARSIPLGWVRDSLEIVGVELQRERMNESGEWADATIVQHIPGRTDYIDEFRKKVRSVGDVAPLIQQVQTHTEDAQRPDFYTLIAGPTWQPPSESADGMNLSQRIDALTKRMNIVSERLERNQRTLARQGKEAAAPPSRPEQRGGGRGGKGGGAQPPPPSETTRPDAKPKVSSIEKKISEDTAELEKLTKEREDLLAQKESGGRPAPTPEATRVPLLENPNVRLWAHDVTAEPGATYRYRTRVVTNNPLFGRDAALGPEQKELAKEPLAFGEWSAWTDLVEVDRKSYYFVTSASERDAVGPARASFELLEFYYGYFRKAAIGLNPGDAVVGDAKLPANLKVFDMDKLASGVKPPAGLPAPSGPGGKGLPPRGEVAPTAPAAADADTASKALDERRTIVTDAMLLGIQRIGAGNDARAVIRTDGGGMTLLTPEQATRGSLLARLEESAKQGESQGQPQVKPREVRETPAFERPELPGRGNAPPDRGGGGGGGGG